MAKKLLNDCFLHDKDRLRHHEALAILRENIQPIERSETIKVRDAVGRICAREVTSPINVPLADNSAVDGYAFTHSDYLAKGGRLKIGPRLAAGRIDIPTLPQGEAARIFTGAVMPHDADSVAMQEDCELNGDTIIIPEGLKFGANCRRAGEDTSENDSVLSTGKILNIQDVTSLTSLGLKEIEVRQKIQVAVFVTGDELVEAGEELQVGQVYNSNGTQLEQLLSTLPVEITNAGILPDNAQSIKTRLQELARNHDLIITTGGASRGEEDYIIDVLDEIGSRHLWQLAIKPGRPMTFGHIGTAKFVGLPGNPVAAFVCFLLYCRPLILRLCGAHWLEPVGYQISAAFNIKSKKPDRREFLRGILQIDKTGELKVTKFARDGSGLITGLREANGLIEIPEDVTQLSEGEFVRFVPFTSFGLPS